MEKEIIEKGLSDLWSEMLSSKITEGDKNIILEKINQEKKFEQSKQTPELAAALHWFKRCVINNEVDTVAVAIYNLQKLFMQLNSLENEDSVEIQNLEKRFMTEFFSITKYGIPRHLIPYSERGWVKDSVNQLFENIKERKVVTRKLIEKRNEPKQVIVSDETSFIGLILFIMGTCAFTSMGYLLIGSVCGLISIFCMVLFIGQNRKNNKKEREIKKLQDDFDAMSVKIDDFSKKMERHISPIMSYRYLINKKFHKYSDKIDWVKTHFKKLDNHKLEKYSNFFNEEGLEVFKDIENENEKIVQNETELQLSDLVEDMVREHVVSNEKKKI